MPRAVLILLKAHNGKVGLRLVIGGQLHRILGAHNSLLLHKAHQQSVQAATVGGVPLPFRHLLNQEPVNQLQLIGLFNLSRLNQSMKLLKGISPDIGIQSGS
ncbi:hypothetical protein SYN63AY4M1_06925 [Synechococcus sp. 63AY4M1]|nr:hypothetical protein SYN63AY4M1_06925 [Synechococcus sp. 63AY4M1]